MRPIVEPLPSKALLQAFGRLIPSRYCFSRKYTSLSFLIALHAKKCHPLGTMSPGICKIRIEMLIVVKTSATNYTAEATPLSNLYLDVWGYCAA